MLEQIIKKSKTKIHRGLLTATLATGLISVLVPGCAALGPRYITPPNAPPIISDWMSMSGASGGRRSEPHTGVDIGGPGYFGHEIVAPADGVVGSVNYGQGEGNYVVINHGQDKDGKKVYTVHIHMQKQLVEVGDKVKRGQTIGLIGETGSAASPGYPHNHYFVEYGGESRRTRPDPHTYWLGIDEYKKRLEKDPNIGPFVIPCFDPKINYPEKPIRFTLPVKCK